MTRRGENQLQRGGIKDMSMRRRSLVVTLKRATKVEQIHKVGTYPYCSSGEIVVTSVHVSSAILPRTDGRDALEAMALKGVNYGRGG